MPKTYSLTGGARIGNANTTYPFADLYADKTVLKINASIVGNLVFQPQDIVSIKRFSGIPIIGTGIKINHRVSEYDPHVVFWTFKNPEFVIDEIKKTGFLNNNHNELHETDFEMQQQQQQGGFPIKKSAVIFYVAAWNLLFLSDIVPAFMNDGFNGIPMGFGINAAVALVFISALLALFSTGFRKLILKKGRDLQDIRKLLYLLILVTGIMTVVFTFSNINK